MDELRQIVIGLSESRPKPGRFYFDFRGPPVTRVDPTETTYSDSGKLGLLQISRCALVILSGGVGSRLNLGKPKLLLQIGNKTLFQIIINRVLARRRQANLSNKEKTLLFLLVSDSTSQPIKEYIATDLPKLFKESDLSSLVIELIMQEHVQCFDISFNPVNEYSPDGNGGLFKALNRSKTFWGSDIDFLHVVSCDNLLVDPLNPVCLGTCVIYKTLYNNGVDVLITCVETDKPNMGIMALKLDESEPIPCIVEYSELGDSISFETAKLGNTCDHVFSVDFVKDYISNKKHLELPWHLAKRNITQKSGEQILVYKLEKFIFDILKYSKHTVAFIIDSDKFAPVKYHDNLDETNPESAISKYNSNRYLFNE